MNQIKDIKTHECILCGGEGQLIYKGVKDFNYGFEGSFNYRSCKARDLLWIDPILAKEELRTFYSSYFTHDNQRGIEKSFENSIIRKIKDLIRKSVLCRLPIMSAWRAGLLRIFVIP